MVFDIIAIIFVMLGALLMLIASIGIIRMPDIYIRMHATTKSTSLGILFIFVGASLVFAEPGVWIKAILSVIFIFMTVPIATHIIGKVAHIMKIPKWHKTIQDDLEEDESK